MTATLNGKVALVTGSSRGIGRAIAVRLAGLGALVCVHYGSNRAAADETVAEIAKNGGKAFAIGADLKKVAEIKNLFASLDKELATRGLSGLDILVNNAGIGGPGGIGDVSEELFDKLIDTNVKGLFFATQEGVKRMRDGGRIINVSSMVSITYYQNVIAYALTKGAVNVMTRNLAAELGPRGICVNALAPGATRTEFSGSAMAPEVEKMISGITALRRIGEPDDIAGVAAFLAGPDGGWITGQLIVASGGMNL